MPAGTVLVVEDDMVSLRVIETALALEDYEISVARDGVEAWEVLVADPARFDTVILDRRMPRMDGMQVLKRMKKDPSFAHIPVILQTSMGSKEDILDGFKAGAYYYIPKPFEQDVFITIVRSAVQYGRMFRGLQEEHQKSMDAMSLLQSGHFLFQTLEEAWFLSSLLSSACPDPARVISGLSELLVNAIEHGNLDMGYAVKSSLNESNAWMAEIKRRLDLPENVAKQAEVLFERLEREIRITIRDEGKGFDWKKFMDLDPSRVFDDHGRGIALARMHSFDHLEYVGRGNMVVVTVYDQPQAD